MGCHIRAQPGNKKSTRIIVLRGRKHVKELTPLHGIPSTVFPDAATSILKRPPLSPARGFLS